MYAQVDVMKAKSLVMSGFMREREGFCLSIFVVAFTHESLEDFTCCIVTKFVPFEV